MTAGKSRIAPSNASRATRRGALALGLAASLTACTISLDDEPRPGATGAPAPTSSAAAGLDSAGDPYVPGDGNGGYDVQHYKLTLDIRPGQATELNGVAEITAKAARRLDRFHLDLTGLTVSEVTVDGAAARWERRGSELIISPSRAPAANARFTVKVRYAGTPKPVAKPPLGTYGWVRTSDGVFVACQPSGAHTWFPANDHPSDKATFEFVVTVPPGLTAIANGEPSGAPIGGGSGAPSTGPGGGNGGVVPVAHRRAAPVTWRVREPMATYLATVTVGRFNVRTGKTPSGITNITAVDPEVRTTDLDAFHAKNAEITEEFTELFGPYPFSSTGGLVDNAEVGFALETQTRPVYGSFGAQEGIVAHEIAHMWFGDSVSVTSWKDIWLNEGFATYAEWIWSERVTGVSPQQQFDQLYGQEDNDELWGVPTGDPGAEQMFSSGAVYTRGAMTLHALRTKVGDGTFFEILKTWTSRYRHSNATTAQFIAVAEQVSGRQLDGFFQDWLYERGRPAR
ncbi:M1 family metallopeptidase [Thermomonospora cellulosilytica]|uniref:Aminopeptidase N n=1 Tax=Thermomonospora cellulosilytica TaxID=1411118 RepID=A0A7W3R7V9_9ACTN|nr:M1 family metallopeptidase [Thermomonospora cellulosilytica]MBA9003613.1 aminopeptidase N [Thermomonospora cellulosilytica]